MILAKFLLVSFLLSLPIVTTANAQEARPSAVRRSEGRACAETRANGDCQRFNDETVAQSTARWGCLAGNPDSCTSFYALAQSRPSSSPPLGLARPAAPVAAGTSSATDVRQAAAAIGFRLSGDVRQMQNATIHYGSQPVENGRIELTGVIVDRHDPSDQDPNFYAIVSTGGKPEKFDEARAICKGIGQNFDLPLFSRRFQLMGVPSFATPLATIRDPRGMPNEVHALWLRSDHEPETRSALKGTAKAFLSTLPLDNRQVLLGKVKEFSRIISGGITFLDGLIIGSRAGLEREVALVEGQLEILSHRRQNLPRYFDLAFISEISPQSIESAIENLPDEKAKKTNREILRSVSAFLGEYPNHATALRTIFRNQRDRASRHAGFNRYIDGPMQNVWPEVFSRQTVDEIDEVSRFTELLPFIRRMAEPNSGQPRLYCAREIPKK